MNKKLKKALYMLGFALPIVAIPIITVACGTQTSQSAPKEANKNQNEQTPKQEAPIQDENKKVVVSSSLSSSKIYDESLLNYNVIELFKLFEQKSNLENIKKVIEKILEKLDNVNILEINELRTRSKELKDLVKAIESIKIKDKILNEIVSETEKVENAVEEAANAVEEAANASEKAAKAEDKKEELEGEKEDRKNALELPEAPENVEISELEKLAEQASENAEIKRESETKTIEKALQAAEALYNITNEKFNEISKNTTRLYKNLFLNKSSFDIENFSELKYNDFLSKFSEVKLINFFNIENLKKHLENLADDNKLNEILLKDIFNSNIDKLIDSFKKDQRNKDIKSDLIETQDNNKLLFNLLKENNATTFEKIKDDLNKDLTQPENIKSLFNKLIFSDLFDVTKLQEKLN